MIQQFYEIGKLSAPQSLVFLLHGYGSDGDNLRDWAGFWQQALPETLFIIPTAPDPIVFTRGYQWFDLGTMSPSLLKQESEKTEGIVREFIKIFQARHNISWEKTAIAGFSQGAMMALCAGLSERKLCKGILAYSGGLYMNADKIKAEPKELEILIVHGEEDTVVACQASLEAEKLLRMHDFSVDLFSIPGLEHSIDSQGLEKGIEFIHKIF